MSTAKKVSRQATAYLDDGTEYLTGSITDIIERACRDAGLRFAPPQQLLAEYESHRMREEHDQLVEDLRSLGIPAGFSMPLAVDNYGSLVARTEGPQFILPILEEIMLRHPLSIEGKGRHYLQRVICPSTGWGMTRAADGASLIVNDGVEGTRSPDTLRDAILALDSIEHAHVEQGLLEIKEETLQSARMNRDEAIWQAVHNGGASKYALAKRLPLSEAHIGRIYREREEERLSLLKPSNNRSRNA